MSNKKRLTILVFLFLLSSFAVYSQDFVPLWSDEELIEMDGVGEMDSLNNEIIYKVNRPGLHIFTPSDFTRNGSAVLIIPGGGYAHQAYRLSGFEIAKWFNTLGVTAFVLRYRLPAASKTDRRSMVPLEDARQAMKMIRANHAVYGIDPDKIGVWGCSAGGHLAASLSTMPENSSDSITRPAFAILVSPVISMGDYGHKSSRENLLGEFVDKPELRDRYSCQKNVTGSTPATFIVHAADDRTVSCVNSILYFKSLTDNGVKGSSLQIFPSGGHGINLTNNPCMTNLWTTLLVSWLKERCII
ncbi:MAG: alpha/beta hydrolase [Staphylococcus sp.]|nr:alpha/beta hydrolase [Staphylococcus sp.]